jgi:hypothetical protein
VHFSWWMRSSWYCSSSFSNHSLTSLLRPVPRHHATPGPLPPECDAHARQTRSTEQSAPVRSFRQGRCPHSTLGVAMWWLRRRVPRTPSRRARGREEDAGSGGVMPGCTRYVHTSISSRRNGILMMLCSAYVGRHWYGAS